MYIKLQCRFYTKVNIVKKLQKVLYTHSTREKIDTACSHPTRNIVIEDIWMAIYSEEEILTSTITGTKTTTKILDPKRLQDLRS